MNIQKCAKQVILYGYKKKLYKRYDKYINIINKRDPLKYRLSQDEKEEISFFWAEKGYMLSSYKWHRYFYAKTKLHDCRFVPEDMFHIEILPEFNAMDIARAWTDKAYLSRILPDMAVPRQMISNVNGFFLDQNFRLISKDEAAKTVESMDEFVVKPTIESGSGKNVKQYRGKADFSEIVRDYGENFCVQELIKQHKEMSRWNISSVNTLRISSGLYKERVFILNAFLRIGEEGEFADNTGTERCFIGISEDGKLNQKGIDVKNQFVEERGGVILNGFQIPYYEHVKLLVKEAHKCLPHFGLAFWDICISESGHPMIVEVNLYDPDITVLQSVCGPFFGKYTEELLGGLKKRAHHYIRAAF